MTRALRRVIALVLVALMATGCSKAVEIPTAELDDPVHWEADSYRIRLNDAKEYRAQRFLVTDSTLVITEMTPSDKLHYPSVTLPHTIRRSDVASVERVRSREIAPMIVAGTVFALLAVFVTAR